MTRTLVTITLLLVSTFALLGTCVYQPGESASQFGDRIRLPQANRFKAPPPLDDQQKALQDRLAAIGKAFPGEVGIAVVDVSSGARMHFEGRKPFPQQSVSKLWVAMTALDLVDQGALDLAEPVSIERRDLTLFHQPIREIVRTRGRYDTDYFDLFERALTESDNTANDRLLRRVGGPTAVDGFLRRQGITGVQFGPDERTKQSAIAGLEWNPSFSMGRGFYDARDSLSPERRRQAFEKYLADPVDGASAIGIAQALARLAKGDILSPASTSFILGTLEKTKSGPNRLKGGTPAGWAMAHKTGTGQVFDGEQSGYNDVGVLRAPDGSQYAIAVMIGRTRSSFSSRFEMMQAVTRAVADHHLSRN